MKISKTLRYEIWFFLNKNVSFNVDHTLMSLQFEFKTYDIDPGFLLWCECWANINEFPYSEHTDITL